MATFTNQARLTYGGNIALSNITVGEILETVSAVKTAVSPSYATDSDVTYSIALVNSAATDADNITVTDNLGEYTTPTAGAVYPLEYKEGSVKLFIDGVLQAAPTVNAGPPLSFSDISLPADSSAVLVYEANITEFAPLAAGSLINNTATVTGDGIAAPIVANATLPVEVQPVLSILKSVSPVAVRDNGRVTYTFTVQNTGNEEVTDAVIDDTFLPRLTGITVTYNGAQLTPTTQYTYDEGTGVFTTNAGVITVPAAAYTQDENTGAITAVPGTATVTVTGTI